LSRHLRTRYTIFTSIVYGTVNVVHSPWSQLSFFFFLRTSIFFLCYYLPFAEERRSLTSSSTRISRRTKCSVCQSNKTLCKNWLRIIRLSGRAWNTLPRPSNRCSYPSPAHEDKRPFTWSKVEIGKSRNRRALSSCRRWGRPDTLGLLCILSQSDLTERAMALSHDRAKSVEARKNRAFWLLLLIDGRIFGRNLRRKLEQNVCCAWHIRWRNYTIRLILFLDHLN
jgi:hypothetical protein